MELSIEDMPLLKSTTDAFGDITEAEKLHWVQKQLRRRFIVIEGPDFSGKSTQVMSLTKLFKTELLLDTVDVSDPGGTALASEMRDIVKARKELHPIAPLSQMLLFQVARNSLVNDIIAPHLRMRRTVICDRFNSSTMIYQGLIGGVNQDLIRALDRYTIGDTIPDITVYLHLSNAVHNRRMVDAKRDEYDFYDSNAGFKNKVLKTYNQHFDENPGNVITVNADYDTDTVTASILRNLMLTFC